MKVPENCPKEQPESGLKRMARRALFTLLMGTALLTNDTRASQSAPLRTLTLEKNRHYSLSEGAEATGADFADMMKKTDIMVGTMLDQDYFSPFYVTYGMDANGRSNAGTLYRGQGKLEKTTCPPFRQASPGGNFPYFTDGMPIADDKRVQKNGVYCLINHDSTRLYRLKVTEVLRDAVKIQYQDMGPTNVKTYGCYDGLCNEKAEVSCVGCTAADLPAIRKTFAIEQQAQTCLSRYLKMDFKPLRMVIYPKTSEPCAAVEGEGQCQNYGIVGTTMRVNGFEGFQNGGESKTQLKNIRLELHEPMHYVNQLAGLLLPSWFNEGMSIQTATQVECGANNMKDSWRPSEEAYASLRDGKIKLKDLAMPDGTLPPHTIGSLFFYGLKQDYTCDKACAAGIWRRLVKAHGGKNEVVTTAQIKSAAEAETGKKLDKLMKLLGLD